MIDFNSLKKYEIPKLRDPEGVIYFLFYRGVLIYVGSSWQLEGRILTHMACKVFDEVRYCIYSNDVINQKEKEFIKHYEPVLNGEFGSSPENFCITIEDILFCFHGKLCFKIEGNSLYPTSNCGKKSKINQDVCGYIDSEKCIYEDEKKEYTYYFVENRIHFTKLNEDHKDFMTRHENLFIIEDAYDIFR